MLLIIGIKYKKSILRIMKFKIIEITALVILGIRNNWP